MSTTANSPIPTLSLNVLISLVILVFLFGRVYAQGTWTQKANFSGEARNGAVGFSINSKGYVGSGVFGGNDFWEYDPAYDFWTQKADLPGEDLTEAASFSIGNYGYVGTGYEFGSGQVKDFRQYDPALNKWTNKTKFPGDKRSYASAFSIGDKGYVGLGSGEQGDRKSDFYQYDPATDAWAQIADLPGYGKSSALGFSIGDKGYVLWGLQGTGESDQLWEFDQPTGEWKMKTPCPGTPRFGAVAFVIDGKAYAGSGANNEIPAAEDLNDFWQYDPATDTWAAVDSFPGEARYAAVGFAIGDTGFLGTGFLGVGNYFNDFWEFTPAQECATPTNLTSTNTSTQSAKLKWDAATGAVKYKVQYKADSTGAPWVSKRINAVNTAITITGLSAGTTYRWKVRNICSNEQSDYSAPAFFTTSLKLENASASETSFDVYPNPFTS
jgi:N-acetylneuraminic acid mutarotase